MRRTSAVISILVTLVLAGCGGGEKAASTTIPVTVAPTTTVPETTTTVAATTTVAPVSTTAPTATDLSPKAKAAVTQQADLPAGWEAVPAEDPQLNLEIVWTELNACLGVPAAKPAGIGTSPTWKRGLATQTRSTVEYTTEPSATASATALAGPKGQTCLRDAFNADLKRSAPEGGVPGPATIAPHNVGPVAPKVSAYRITADISLGELKVPITQDFVLIFSGGTIIRTLFLQPGSEFPQELERSLLQKIIARTA